MNKIRRFYLDYKNSRIILDDMTVIKINNTELQILTLLLSSSNIYSQEELFHFAWNKDKNYSIVVPQAISLLRKKLYKYNVNVIITVRGKGYKANSEHYNKINSFIIRVNYIMYIALTYLNVMR